MPSTATNERLTALGLERIKHPVTLAELLRRPGINLFDLAGLDERIAQFGEHVAYQVELNVKYQGYTDRQKGDGGEGEKA